MSNISIAYSMTYEGLCLDIALIETEKLYIHEETIPARLENLKRRIERDGVQSAPILGDNGTSWYLTGCIGPPSCHTLTAGSRACVN